MKCQGWKHTSSAAGLPGEEGDAGEEGAPGAPWPGEAGRTLVERFDIEPFSDFSAK